MAVVNVDLSEYDAIRKRNSKRSTKIRLRIWKEVISERCVILNLKNCAF